MLKCRLKRRRGLRQQSLRTQSTQMEATVQASPFRRGKGRLHSEALAEPFRCEVATTADSIESRQRVCLTLCAYLSFFQAVSPPALYTNE